MSLSTVYGWLGFAWNTLKNHHLQPLPPVPLFPSLPAQAQPFKYPVLGEQSRWGNGMGRRYGGGAGRLGTGWLES